MRIVPTLAFCWATSGWAQAIPIPSRPADAGLPGEWLHTLPVSARSAGIAGASTGLSGAALAPHNPTGLLGGRAGEAELMIAPLFSGAQFQTLSVSSPLSLNRWLGLSLFHLNSGDAERTDALGRPLGSFQEEEIAFFLSYAEEWEDVLGFGANLKVVRQSMLDLSTTGVGLDLGWRIHPPETGFTLGFSLSNLLAPSLKLKEEKEKFPLALRGGAAYDTLLLGRRTLFSLDWIQMEKDSSPRWAGGMEWNPFPQAPLFLRWGANHKELALGFGIHYGLISFDYATAFHVMETLHRLGFTFRYGLLKSVSEKYLQTEWEKLSDAQQELRHLRETQRKEAQFRKLLARTQKALKEGDVKEFRKELERLQFAFPQDPRTLALQKELDARDIEPRFHKALGRAQKFYQAGFHLQARQAAEEAVGYHPYDSQARLLLFLTRAQIALVQKEYLEAKKQLDLALEIDPGNLEALTLLRRLRNILELVP